MRSKIKDKYRGSGNWFIVLLVSKNHEATVTMYVLYMCYICVIYLLYMCSICIAYAYFIILNLVKQALFLRLVVFVFGIKIRMQGPFEDAMMRTHKSCMLLMKHYFPKNKPIILSKLIWNHPIKLFVVAMLLTILYSIISIFNKKSTIL